MNSIAQLNRKLAGLEAKVRSLVSGTIRRNQKQIVKRVNDQLKKGEDANGKLKADGEPTAYGKYRSKPYIAQRKRFGRQTKFVDLNFFGDFKASMFVKMDTTGLSFGVDATDKKKDILVHHWGEDIMAMNDENFDWLFGEIYNDMVSGLQKYFT